MSKGEPLKPKNQLIHFRTQKYFAINISVTSSFFFVFSLFFSCLEKKEKQYDYDEISSWIYDSDMTPQP